MRFALMIEGQEGVTWDEWVALARACEEHGLEGLFRSDHYQSVFESSGRGSLDAWATLAGLAAVTERIRLGTMVSPATFRRPSILARMVATVDHISGGRVELGLGAGWNQAEHDAYGFPFPAVGERMEILEEQLEIVHRQWTEDEFSFDGRHYRLERSRAEPKPVQRPRPPIVLGGAAGPRAARLAARWADEYNTIFATPEKCRERRARIVDACEREGREPIPFSLMTACCVGRDREEALARARRRLDRTGRDGGDPAELLGDDSTLIGTVDEVVARLGSYRDAGVERVFLQHLDHADLDMVRLIGEEIVPAFV
jgi:F420-dependent oxidoreductase-like protein